MTFNVRDGMVVTLIMSLAMSYAHRRHVQSATDRPCVFASEINMGSAVAAIAHVVRMAADVADGIMEFRYPEGLDCLAFEHYINAFTEAIHMVLNVVSADDPSVHVFQWVANHLDTSVRVPIPNYEGMAVDVGGRFYCKGKPEPLHVVRDSTSGRLIALVKHNDAYVPAGDLIALAYGMPAVHVPLAKCRGVQRQPVLAGLQPAILDKVRKLGYFHDVAASVNAHQALQLVKPMATSGKWSVQTSNELYTVSYLVHSDFGFQLKT